MPIEIRELVIKAAITESGDEGGSRPDSQTLDREQIIADCVEEVMEILRAQLER